MKNLDMSKLILYTCFQSYFCLLKSCFGKCLQKMSPEKLFEKFVKSAEIFKSDKSGQQKNLYRLVNQLHWLFILPPCDETKFLLHFLQIFFEFCIKFSKMNTFNKFLDCLFPVSHTATNVIRRRVKNYTNKGWFYLTNCFAFEFLD